MTAFSAQYLKCAVCGTLVVAAMPPPEALNDADYYWLRYEADQMGSEGFPSPLERARLDLPGRCLYWLRALLRFKVPPARVLELGSGHGAFVALLRWAGFDAAGLELSPRMAEFARTAFDAPVTAARVEARTIEGGSLDASVAMDVLEHLEDPGEGLRGWVDSLDRRGVLLLQTPCFPEEASYEQLLARDDPFLRHLKPEQHFFLFSRRSATLLMERLGLHHIEFLPAIFAHYDMFLAASRAPIEPCSPHEVRERLVSTPCGRMVEALLAKDDELHAALQRVSRGDVVRAASEADRAARLELINEQGRRLGALEAERNNLAAERDALRRNIEAIESDRAARLEVIQEQGRRLGQLESEHNKLINEQGRRLGALETERNNLAAERDALRRNIEAIESDRAARLEVIQEQGRRLGALETERNDLAAERDALRGNVAAIESDRAARLEVIQEQGRRLGQLESEHNNTLAERRDLDRQGAMLRDKIQEQSRWLAEMEQKCSEASAEAATFEARLSWRQALLDRIRRGRIYRTVRWFGGWKWIDEELRDQQ